jgi:hypothetical protein
MQKTYDKAIIGKHVHSPPKSPDNHKLARCEEDRKVSADVGDQPKLVLVSMKAAESFAKSEASLPSLRDNDSVSTSVICPETVHHRKMHDAVVPFVTPATGAREREQCTSAADAATSQSTYPYVVAPHNHQLSSYALEQVITHAIT